MPYGKAQMRIFFISADNIRTEHTQQTAISTDNLNKE
jgi:hypothetical protein